MLEQILAENGHPYLLVLYLMFSEDSREAKGVEKDKVGSEGRKDRDKEESRFYDIFREGDQLLTEKSVILTDSDNAKQVDEGHGASVVVVVEDESAIRSVLENEKGTDVQPINDENGNIGDADSDFVQEIKVIKVNELRKEVEE